MASEPLSARSRVSEGGRIVIPAEFRRAMGLDIGDEVILRLEGNVIQINSVPTAVQRAQEKVRQYVTANRSLSAELIAERRQEAARE